MQAEDDGPPSINVRARVSLMSEMKLKLTPNRETLFRATCFGPWLDLTDTTADPLLLYAFFQHQSFPPNGTEDEMYFQFGPHQLHFGPADFCLITGLRFGSTPSDPSVKEGFVFRLFGEHKPKLDKVMATYHTLSDDDGMDDLDAVRVCLMLTIDLFFLGRQGRMKVTKDTLTAIENLGYLNSYPWGSVIWKQTVTQMYDCLRRGAREVGASKKLSIAGFLFGFKVS